MKRIEWQEALRIGHAEIDAQHRRLVETFNALHDAVYRNGGGAQEDALLDRLIALAEENFRTEEALMAAHPAQDSAFQVHREIHDALLRELRLLREGLARCGAHVNAKTVNFVRKWLFDHFTHTDRELVRLTR